MNRVEVYEWPNVPDELKICNHGGDENFTMVFPAEMKYSDAVDYTEEGLASLAPHINCELVEWRGEKCLVMCFAHS